MAKVNVYNMSGEAVSEIEKKAFEGFSEEEKSQMITLLGRLTENLM